MEDEKTEKRTWPEWQHKLTMSKPYPEGGVSRVIKVKAGLHYIEGNRAPYFTVTGEIGWLNPNRDCDMCGQLHTEILAVWPELKPVVDLHLSDSEGQPMHAAANGWYWLAGYYGGAGERYHGGSGDYRKSPEDCLTIFADHVRVTTDHALYLADRWQKGVEYSEARGPMTDWIQEQRGRWKAEASAAIELLEKLKLKNEVK